jgi:hypothetical protein
MAAVVLAAPAGAAHTGASVQATVPAPAVGKGSLQSFAITATGSAKSVKVTVTNRRQLQKGFGAIAIVQDPKTATGETFQISLLMYMGNFSTSPASTVHVEVTAPAGVKLGKPKKTSARCTQLAGWNTGFESGSDHFTDAKGDVVTLEDTLPPVPGWDVSPSEGFLDGVLPLAWSALHCPGKPEDASKEPGDSPK